MAQTGDLAVAAGADIYTRQRTKIDGTVAKLIVTDVDFLNKTSISEKIVIKFTILLINFSLKKSLYRRFSCFKFPDFFSFQLKRTRRNYYIGQIRCN